MAMNLENVLSKVQKLIAKAEHESTPPDEAKLAQSLADKLMLDYALDQETVDKTRPAASRSKPGTVSVPLVGDDDLIGFVVYLSKEVAAHCSCKIRPYSTWTDGSWNAKVYGFESDLRYFNMLYTTLRLHMVGALRPGIDPAKSIEDNAYALHNAGLNWFDMAKLEGWVEITPKGTPKPMYRNRKTEEVAGWPPTIGKWKSAYARAIKARGEAPLRISPSGVATFQRSAAEGYVIRIARRLKEVRDGRAQIGNALARRESEVDALFREENPELFVKVKPSNSKAVRARKATYRPFNQQAYESGMRQANTANLNPSTSPGNTQGISSQ